VKAEINVKNAVIGGKVIGNINATNKIELQSGSHIEGDIHTHRLVIDEGVFFEGSCKMGGGVPETETRRPDTVVGQTGVGVGGVGVGQPVGQKNPVRDKVGV
jgi:cytoskeletal protein CcmA (bactofilin family)